MKRSLLVGLGIGLSFAWAAGCGSSGDDSKGGKHGGGSGGTGEESGTGGSTSGTGGKSTGGRASGGSAGSSGAEGGASGEAGSPSGGGGTGGSSAGSGGAGGEGGESGPECPAGKAECDGNLGELCETTLASDAEHCGRCGRNCTIGDATCTNGLCDPVTLFTAADLPFGTDVQGNRTWTYDPASASLIWLGYNRYTVWRYPVDGSPRQLIWDPMISNQTAGTESAVVIGGEVYWSIGGSPPIVYKKAVTAGSTVAPTDVFHPVARASFLRVVGSAFYWMSGDYQDPTPAPPTHTGYVYTRAVSAAADDPGTAIVTVDQGNFGNIQAFQPTSNALYWVTNVAGSGVSYELRTAPIAGGAPTVVPAVPGATSAAISTANVHPAFATAGKTLYFSVNGMSTGVNGIYRYESADRAPSLVAAADYVSSLLLDANFIYYVRSNGAGVFRVPLAGGTSVSISAAYGQKIVGQDATYLYVLQSGCCTSVLQRIIK